MNEYRRIPWDEIMCRLKGTSDARSEAVLAAWMEERPLNRKVYDELAVLWESVRREDIDFDADAAWTRVKSLTTINGHAASVAVKSKRNFRGWISGVACTVAAVFFMAAGFYVADTRPSDFLGIEHYTPLNGKSQLRLSDGTDVCLRNGSSLSLKDSQSSGRREVRLDGEAYFHVARNEDVPFIVRAANVEVCVHGTEFNVREVKPSGDVFVSLHEGSVAIKTDKEIRMMVPGDIIRCSVDGTVSSVQGDVLQENCWSKSSLEFKGWSLNDVCRCLSRWFDVKISVAPEIAGLYKFNFTLRNESLDEILSMMALTSPIAYTFRLDGSVQVYKK